MLLYVHVAGRGHGGLSSAFIHDELGICLPCEMGVRGRREKGACRYFAYAPSKEQEEPPIMPQTRGGHRGFG